MVLRTADLLVQGSCSSNFYVEKLPVGQLRSLQSIYLPSLVASLIRAPPPAWNSTDRLIVSLNGSEQTANSPGNCKNGATP